MQLSTQLNSTDWKRRLDVTGEYIRSKLVDDQEGIPLHLDIQLVDLNNCQPMEDVFLELWSKSYPHSNYELQRRSHGDALKYH
jgi:hypothetical protein